MADEPLPLTPKQEAFAQAYVETGNASEAYRQAYDAHDWKPTSVMVEASRMINHPKISLRIGELRGEAFERHGMTIEALKDLLMDDRDFAKENGAAAAAVAATNGLAKLYGLGADNLNLSSPDGSMTPPTLIKIVAPSPKQDDDGSHA